MGMYCFHLTRRCDQDMSGESTVGSLTRVGCASAAFGASHLPLIAARESGCAVDDFRSDEHGVAAARVLPASPRRVVFGIGAGHEAIGWLRRRCREWRKRRRRRRRWWRVRCGRCGSDDEGSNGIVINGSGVEGEWW